MNPDSLGRMNPDSRGRSLAARCAICDRLPPADLLELDTLLGDPALWPSTIWAFFSPPEGGLPASYRRFGAVRVGREWLDTHGWEGISNHILRKHFKQDVVHVARDPMELVELGIIQKSKPQYNRIPVNPSLDAGAVIRYFNAGVQMGEAALKLLATRINAAIDDGVEPDPKTVMRLADLGSKLAVAQAQLVARGAKFGQDEDEDDAFRGSEAGERIGHHRARVIEGETRMVKDSGPADREQYNQRAREEGSPLLD